MEPLIEPLDNIYFLSIMHQDIMAPNGAKI